MGSFMVQDVMLCTKVSNEVLVKEEQTKLSLMAMRFYFVQCSHKMTTLL